MINKQQIEDYLNTHKNDMVELSKKFVSFNSVNPRTGGPGEKEAADWLMTYLKTMKFDDIKQYNAPDTAVSYGYRPNIVAVYKGKNPNKTFWIITHTDKVPEGDRNLWNSDPFIPIVKDGKIYGRGAEDNGASLVSSIFAVKALMDLGIKPACNVGICLVADEETGSEYGISYLISQNVFKSDDWFFVPDGGNPEGSFIEIAEKSIVWMKFTTKGKQAHASLPHLAINAHRYGMKFAIEVDEMLHSRYNMKNVLFNPPFSTFEITKKESNVDNINTIPGTDIFYFDTRILPEYNVDEIFESIKAIASRYEKEYNVAITMEFVQKGIAPQPTDPNHPMVTLLKSIVADIKKTAITVGGIGGGTCAALLRRVGFPAVVWSTVDETAHQPNECAKIDNIVGDALVFALFCNELN